jgi:hypothetical protein
VPEKLHWIQEIQERSAEWRSRQALLDRQTEQRFQDTTRAVARSRDLLENTQVILTPDSPNLPLEQLADAFATQAVKSALAPTPDGLDVFAELARKMSKPTR